MRAKIAMLLMVCSTALLGATGLSSSVSGFLLGGNAQHAKDPENPSNDVIKIDTASAPLHGTVSRTLGVKVAQLDNMLEFKSYFQNRSCGGGSPRVQLAIDMTGDGVADANAFGYTAPPFAGCPPNRWQHDDLTDELPRWDVSQLFAFGFPALSNNLRSVIAARDKPNRLPGGRFPNTQRLHPVGGLRGCADNAVPNA